MVLHLEKASEAEAYFDGIIKTTQGVKIKTIFSSCPSFNKNDEYRMYSEDAPIYVAFEDGRCLVIEYRYIDSLYVDFRSLNEEDAEMQKDQLIEDYFNCSVDVHGWSRNEKGETEVGKAERTEKISLTYDALVAVKFHRVSTAYGKWQNGNITEVLPTMEAFDEIKFVMQNGNSFTLCADSGAEGYVWVWSNEAKEETIPY